MSRGSIHGVALASALACLVVASCGPPRWSNYLDDHTVLAERFEPEDALEVLALVREKAARGERVRAVGSGHSSSEVAQPSEGHAFVDLGRIDRVMSWDYYREPVDTGRFVRVGAGATIAEVNQYLALHTDRALFNMGNYDAQTLAGAFSTGTHGSGLRHGPITERIVAIELVTDERHPVTGARTQRLLRLEPTAGVTDAQAFGAAHGQSADPEVQAMELEQDDEAFDAALVNLGCFGIVVAVTVETRRHYWLDETDTVHVWEHGNGPDLRALADAHTEFLQLTLVPHEILSGPDRGRVIYRQTVRTDVGWQAAPPKPRPPSREDDGRLWARIFSSGSPEILSLVSPKLALRTVASTFRQQASAPRWASRSDVVLINSLAPELDATSIDIQVPFETANAAIERILELAKERGTVAPGPIQEEWWHTSPIGIRFVGASRALLAPTYDGPRVSFEIPLLYDLTEGPRTRALHDQYRERMLHELETELTCDAFGGRPHWGQRNWMTQERAARMYGERWERWKHQYQRFNAHGTFSNAFTERMGLSGTSPCNADAPAPTEGGETPGDPP